jgi:hypothetical protein
MSEEESRVTFAVTIVFVCCCCWMWSKLYDEVIWMKDMPQDSIKLDTCYNYFCISERQSYVVCIVSNFAEGCYVLEG